MFGSDRLLLLGGDKVKSRWFKGISSLITLSWLGGLCLTVSSLPIASAQSPRLTKDGHELTEPLVNSTSVEDLSRSITLITYSDWPYASMDHNKPKGLLIEVVSELFRRANLSYQLRFYPLKRGMLMVDKREFHCMFPVDRSQEREVHYTWISPILISRYGLYSSPIQTTPLTTLNDAKPYNIGSFLGSGIGEYLQKSGFRVEFTARNQQNLKKLSRQRIDLWASELVSAASLMKKHKINLGKPELIFFTSVRALACSKDLPYEYHHLLQSALTAMYKDGFMSRLYSRYGVEF